MHAEMVLVAAMAAMADGGGGLATAALGVAGCIACAVCAAERRSSSGAPRPPPQESAPDAPPSAAAAATAAPAQRAQVDYATTGAGRGSPAERVAVRDALDRIEGELRRRAIGATLTATLTPTSCAAAGPEVWP